MTASASPSSSSSTKRACAPGVRNPEHIEAQKLARQKYYTEYHVQVCTLDRESKFNAEEAAKRAPAAARA